MNTAPDWIPVEYAAVGTREQLEDLVAKLYEAERHSLESNLDLGENVVIDCFGDPECSLDNAFLYGLFGVYDVEEGRDYWISERHMISEDRRCFDFNETSEEPVISGDIIFSVTTPYEICKVDDRLSYVKWSVGHSSIMNPKLLEAIESYYPGMKVYFYDAVGNTNDDDRKFFAGKFPISIDGLNYFLNDDNMEATLNCDEMWTEEVMAVRESVDYNGKRYTVTGIADFRYYRMTYFQYGIGGSERPYAVRELVLPPSVRSVSQGACRNIVGLRKVSVPDNCEIGLSAFENCGIEELVLGENVKMTNDSFAYTAVRSVNIPESTRFEHVFEDDGPQWETYVQRFQSSDWPAISVAFNNSVWEMLASLEKVDLHERHIQEVIDEDEPVLSCIFIGGLHPHFLGTVKKLISLEGPAAINLETVVGILDDSDLEWLYPEARKNAAAKEIISIGRGLGVFTQSDEQLELLYPAPEAKASEEDDDLPF